MEDGGSRMAVDKAPAAASPSSTLKPEPSKGVQRRKRGRPATLTLEGVQRLGALIAKGLTEEQACLVAEISYPAFKKAEQRRPEFVLAIKKAQAAYLNAALDIIQVGIPGWQGHAWILERRHKAQFSRTAEVEINTHQTLSIGIPQEALDELAELAKKRFVG